MALRIVHDRSRGAKNGKAGELAGFDDRDGARNLSRYTVSQTI
jgi:hypothetical protein